MSQYDWAATCFVNFPINVDALTALSEPTELNKALWQLFFLSVAKHQSTTWKYEQMGHGTQTRNHPEVVAAYEYFVAVVKLIEYIYEGRGRITNLVIDENQLLVTAANQLEVWQSVTELVDSLARR